MESFSGYIKSMRLKSGQSLREVAAKLQVSSTYYADVEKGRRYPMDLEKLMQLGRIMGMNEKEIHKMLDLAGEARGTAAPDVTAYIVSHPCVGQALRIAQNVQAQCADWEWFTDMLVNKYRPSAPEG